MHPDILSALAEQRAAELRTAAAEARLARAARRAAVRRHGTAGWLASGRRSGRIELIWPDGVRSVVSLRQASESDDKPRRRLAGSRR